jgi:hypothetical protein
MAENVVPAGPAPQVAPSDLQRDVDQTLRALEQLLALFRFERMVYLGVTVLALIILLVTAAFMLMSRDSHSVGVALGMFGSTGLITFTTSRLLTMWNQAFALIRSALKAKIDE